jgi:hypothetical protein
MFVGAVKMFKKKKKSLTPDWHVEIFASHTQSKQTTIMRTKTFLLSAAVIAAGLSVASAQSVFSVNAVGYVNVPLVAGFQIIANPLNNSNNLLSEILPSVANNTTVYRFNPTNQTFYNASTFFLDPGPPPVGVWFPDAKLAPGEGAFFSSPVAQTLTFVGEVPQGNLVNSVPPNYSLRSSIVPQSGGISSVLGLTAENNDTVYFFNPANQGYGAALTYFVDPGPPPVGVWFPSEPTPAVGQGFWFKNNTGTSRSWTRTFSVN